MKPINEGRLQVLLDYISNYQKDNGKSPSYRTIQADLGYSTVSLVAKDVGLLKSRGWIESDSDSSGIAIPVKLRNEGTINAAIVGACPCGEPITAIENIEATVSLPVEIFGKEEHIILRATGRSMINCGIFNGDLMVVRVQSTANIGDIVVARVNGEDATAKVLAQKDGQYYLKPANDEIDAKGNRKYKDIYPEGEWDIIGVVDNVIHAPRVDIRL